ncbi:hypothetical protein NDU88_007830 [Pleurodeles waltl]|uniref:Uncharacterized protein n=1 Tax=Pleurodeles waltl TaxID=8319 RepID=A0AAV7P3A1_PLEWA|nr:hypothetical protein NDU88_007830 [Pleurodeles waltl]
MLTYQPALNVSRSVRRRDSLAHHLKNNTVVSERHTRKAQSVKAKLIQYLKHRRNKYELPNCHQEKTPSVENVGAKEMPFTTFVTSITKRSGPSVRRQKFLDSSLVPLVRSYMLHSPAICTTTKTRPPDKCGEGTLLLFSNLHHVCFKVPPPPHMILEPCLF